MRSRISVQPCLRVPQQPMESGIENIFHWIPSGIGMQNRTHSFQKYPQSSFPKRIACVKHISNWHLKWLISEIAAKNRPSRIDYIPVFAHSLLSSHSSLKERCWRGVIRNRKGNTRVGELFAPNTKSARLVVCVCHAVPAVREHMTALSIVSGRTYIASVLIIYHYSLSWPTIRK